MPSPHRARAVAAAAQCAAVEVCTPADRCLLKLPEHWSEGAKTAGALRWIGSGGSALVFGVCDRNCPLKDETEERGAGASSP